MAFFNRIPPKPIDGITTDKCKCSNTRRTMWIPRGPALNQQSPGEG